MNQVSTHQTEPPLECGLRKHGAEPMSLSTRLAWALDRAGMRPSALARAAKVGRAAVSLWVNGHTQSIDGANLARVARALDVSCLWLATGEGAPTDHISLHERELLQLYRQLPESAQRLALQLLATAVAELRVPLSSLPDIKPVQPD